MAAACVENATKLGDDSSVASNRRKSTMKQRKSKSNSKSKFIPRFGCLRLDAESPTVDSMNQDGSVDMVSADAAEEQHHPTHLIIMINGIIGSSQNWRYAAKQFLKAHPQEVLVHCSERNTSTLTFDGIDVMGERLADEVISVIQRYPHLCKISFIGHSLGGLIARYTIALLFGRNYLNRLSNVHGSNDCIKLLPEENYIGKVAGLEPVNFITFATPHLGSRGHNQVPMFCGFHTLELLARQASWFLGRTGRHLFLTDKEKEKPPLLLRMASDCEDLPFMSALQSFKRRVAYANMRFDQIVGWCTSSLRHESELPKRRHIRRNGRYRHIVNVETGEVAPPRRVSTLGFIIYGWKRLRTRDMMEEMIKGLTTVSWERVDVRFGGGRHRLVAHNSVQASSSSLFSLLGMLYMYLIEYKNQTGPSIIRLLVKLVL